MRISILMKTVTSMDDLVLVQVYFVQMWSILLQILPNVSKYRLGFFSVNVIYSVKYAYFLLLGIPIYCFITLICWGRGHTKCILPNAVHQWFFFISLLKMWGGC